MQKILLLGDEAIALGAMDGGLSGMYAYPGTPSTEIMEYIQSSEFARERSIHRHWSANEKTALEEGLGMSYAGKKAMVAMKHVGLNVAADAFMNSSITGVNGGLVIVAADDPSMHSSQNEQDSRYYANFAFMPILEPANQQEAYDMAYSGLLLSEKFSIPVMLRLTTRLAHSRAGVSRKEVLPQNNLKLPDNSTQFVLLPAIARVQYQKLLDKQPALIVESENSVFNGYIDGQDKSLGIITCGIAYNYLVENFEDHRLPFPVVKVCQYPLPRKMIEKLIRYCEKILILEDGYPIIEENIAGFQRDSKIRGRLTGDLPRTGELNPTIVAKALQLDVQPGMSVPDCVQNRPPALCQGCGHIDAYHALNEAMEEHGKGKVFSDIGCYTLGALPPFDAIYSCVDMGASITMAKGAADAGLHPAVCVIGDSTFTHSGITGLLDAVSENSPITVIISDNFTTGMTGGQDSQALGHLEDICLGLGVAKEHIRILTPLKKNHLEMVKIMKEEIEYQGVSVIIPRRQCIQTIKNEKLKHQLGTLNLL